ncbi:unnamed protein product, partial [Rotaria socialis]
NTNDDNPNDKEDNVNEDMKDDIDDGDDDGQSTLVAFDLLSSLIYSTFDIESYKRRLSIFFKQ